MKNIDTTAKFNFKKTTITVFNKQVAGQVQFANGDDTSSIDCWTVKTVATHIDTSFMGY
ncbi:hypothetical protein LGH70_17025 [Hymenobacter sp. BT635]|uniref:Uncharacterized protein n=1 Tax=Hymenobacter nitidus TaxID=2880929 RepID=A0ABS8AFV1_9BACT|nr:hypothetical protein [Hymenobacter nitidus]MCB2379303.1 hypothetical protein [Hymenobacter nitidus]